MLDEITCQLYDNFSMPGLRLTHGGKKESTGAGVARLRLSHRRMLVGQINTLPPGDPVIPKVNIYIESYPFCLFYKEPLNTVVCPMKYAFCSDVFSLLWL